MGVSSCGSWALEHRLSSCGAWAELLRGMWDLPRPGKTRESAGKADSFFFFFNIYLFLAVQGVCCCAVFALVVASGGYSFVAVCRLLIALASLVVEHGLQELQHLG